MAHMHGKQIVVPPEKPVVREVVRERPHAATEVRKILQGAQDVSSVARQLREVQRSQGIPMPLLRTHALHQATEKDDLLLAEHVCQSVTDGERFALVNSPLGAHSYTPLCRAAYSGSLRLLKFFVAASADIHFRNSHGENIRSCLQAGLEAQGNKTPDNMIFIKYRYEECLNYVEACFKWAQESARDNGANDLGANARPKYRPPGQRREEAARLIIQWWKSNSVI